jgi:hypothetical protein
MPYLLFRRLPCILPIFVFLRQDYAKDLVKLNISGIPHKAQMEEKGINETSQHQLAEMQKDYTQVSSDDIF